MAAPNSNWLFVFLLLGNMILTFSLELIAVCPPEYDATKLNFIMFGIWCFALALVPGFFYVAVTGCFDCTRVAKSHCSFTYFKRYDHKCGRKDCNDFSLATFLTSVLCAVCGPLLYYYGNNITKVVDMFGISNTTQGNITDNNALVLSDECQSGLRASAVATLFAFILISNIDWQPNSDSRYLWGPVPDMLVKLVPLDAFYSALLEVAHINMISTSTMFCGGIDKAFFGTVFVIANIYAIFSIGRSIIKYNRYKLKIGVLGCVIWFIFVVYLLADKLLPLNYYLCNVPVDDDVKMAAAMHSLHIARAALSGVFTFLIVMLYVVSESVYGVHKLITQAQLATQLENKLNTLLNKNDNEMAKLIVHSVAISVAKSVAKSKAAQPGVVQPGVVHSYFETAMIEYRTQWNTVANLLAADTVPAVDDATVLNDPLKIFIHKIDRSTVI